MMVKRRLLILAVTLSCAACYDFVDPDFPEAGAPAVLQLSAFTEPGGVSLSGVLVPGLDVGGVQRDVVNDTLRVFGTSIGPSGIRANGSREYSYHAQVTDEQASVFDITAPLVGGVMGPPPHVRWYGIRRVGADTLQYSGADLELRTDTAAAMPSPVPGIRQWFVALVGGTERFSISGDGAPPPVLRIPPQFVPSAATIQVVLSFNQAAIVQNAGYVGNFSYTSNVHWTVVRTGP